MKRRLFSLVLTAAAVAGAASCGGGGGSAATNTTQPTVPDSTTTTAVMDGPFTPAAAGRFTVAAALPAPGWWNGTSADHVTGGYEYAMAKEMAKRLGAPKTVVKNVSYETLVAGDAGDASAFDVALAEVPISERHRDVDYTIPYFPIDQGVMVNTGTTVTDANLQDLQWGVQRGTSGQALLEEHIRPARAPKTYEDLDALFAALKSGDVDAVLMDTLVELPQARGQHATVVGQFTTGEAYGGVLAKGSANLGAINKVIKAMTDDGTLDRLAATWLTPALEGNPTKVPYLRVP